MIETCGRLVGEDDGGIVDECAGNGDALALTDRKLPRKTLEHRCHSQFGEQVLRPRERRAIALERADEDVFEYRQIVDEKVLLEDKAKAFAPQGDQATIAQVAVIAPIENNASLIRVLQPAHQIQKRRFARPGRPDNSEKLAAIHLNAHPIDRVSRAVAVAID